MPMSQSERSLRGKLATHTGWANTVDRTARTAPGTKASPASVDYWLDKVDPDGQMTDQQRRAAADSARKAYFSRLAFASAKARRAKREAS